MQTQVTHYRCNACQYPFSVRRILDEAKQTSVTCPRCVQNGKAGANVMQTRTEEVRYVLAGPEADAYHGENTPFWQRLPTSPTMTQKPQWMLDLEREDKERKAAASEAQKDPNNVLERYLRRRYQKNAERAVSQEPLGDSDTTSFIEGLA